jgi:hypothetical protein
MGIAFRGWQEGARQGLQGERTARRHARCVCTLTSIEGRAAKQRADHGQIVLVRCGTALQYDSAVRGEVQVWKPARGSNASATAMSA